MALTDKLSAIGDAIRAKTGKEEKLTLDQMPDEIAGISGGVLTPLVATENGVYDPTYETVTVTWDEATEYDGALSVDGIPLRYKKAANLTVPDDVSELENPEYCFAVNLPDGTVQSTPLSELRLGSADGIYLANDISFAVVWVKDATYVNAGYGASLEDNTVYVTDYLWLAHGDEYAGMFFSLTAQGQKIDGFSSVTVEVNAVAGSWKINSCGNHFFTEHVNFTALYNGDTRNFQGMRHSEDAASDYLEYLDEGNWVVAYSAVNGWVDGVDVIDFGDEPQVVSPAFKEWLTANATRQESPGGGLAINGIIEQYKVNAGATVNAGDFVEFVNKCGSGVFRNGNTSSMSACKLDNSRILVVYSDNGDSLAGKAIVLTIDGEAISVGSEKYFNSTNTFTPSVVALTDNKAVVMYGYSSGSYGYAVALTIDGSTISVGSKYEFCSSRPDSISAIALTDSKVLVAYSWEYTSKRSRAKVLKISGTTISDGEYCTIAYDNSTNRSLHKLTKLNESTAVLIYYYDSKYYLCVLATDGTTLSASAKTTTYRMITALSDTKILAVYNDSNNSSYYSAEVMTLSGMSIVSGNPVVLCEKSVTTSAIMALSESKALVTFGNSAMVISVDGENICAGTEVNITDSTSISYVNIVPFSASSAFVVFVGDSLGMYASLSIDGDNITVADASGTYVQPATGRLHNVGVAATGGASGETVDVVVVGDGKVIIGGSQPLIMQTKEVNITKPGIFELTPDSGYTGISKAIVGVDAPQLTAPNISLDGDTLTIEATDDNTEAFAIFVDGIERATVANEEV